jgi:hypothetical protein
MTTDRHSGTKLQYRWYEAADLFLGEVLSKVPCLVRQRFVAVTAFDSSPLRPTQDERAAGWRTVEDIAISPRVTDINELTLVEQAVRRWLGL